VRALNRLGHRCAVFWRSTSEWSWANTPERRMTQRLTARRALRTMTAALPSINPDLRARNRRLLEFARTFRPDLILLMGGNEVITPRTLAALKDEHGAPLVLACGTPPSVFARPIERRAARLYDLVAANDRDHALEWRGLGSANVAVLPLSAIDPAFHHPVSPTPVGRHDVGFVGTLVPSKLYSRRRAALEALLDFDLAIWSIHEVPPSLRPAFRGPALGETMMQALSACKIVVNPNGDFMRYGGNMRLFEACGAGALQIAEDCPAAHRWFTVGRHIVTYTDPADLARKVAYYLSHDDERQSLAAAGRAHVLAHHTYDQRIARLLNLLERVRRGSDLADDLEGPLLSNGDEAGAAP
jgi:spore maturation protein CgeB